MERPLVEDILDILEHALERPEMHLNIVDTASAENFISGFTAGCAAFGMEQPLAIRQLVTTRRGWKWIAVRPIDEMRRGGFSEVQIVRELFTIEIECWQETQEGLK